MGSEIAVAAPVRRGLERLFGPGCASAAGAATPHVGRQGPQRAAAVGWRGVPSEPGAFLV